MGPTRVTIAALARSLRLSTCTVSKILNRSFSGFSYSEKTIRRVERAARKTGYIANAQARSLRTQKTMLIGFLLPSARISLFGALTDHLELELRKRGYHVLIVHSRNDPESEPKLISALLARGIDGLAWIPSLSRVELRKFGLRADFPAVILDRPNCTDKLPFIATDNRVATRILAQRIYDLGHRSIAVLNSPANDRSMEERLDGICDVFGKSVRAFDIPNDAAAARNAVPRLMADRRRPGILVALSEPLAIGALASLRDLGLSIPKDISFAAFDDFPLAAHWSPRITVMRQELEPLAATAVQLLMQRLLHPRKPFDNIRIPATLQWRESITLRTPER